MNETDVMADGKTPFEPQAADLGGCGKPAVIGCLGLLVLLAVALVITLTKATDMLDWAMARYQEAVVENLSPEVTEAERLRLESAFAAAREAIRDNRMDPQALQRLQRFMASPPGPGRAIEPSTVRELSEVLESVAGASGAAPIEEALPPPSAGGLAAWVHYAAL